MKFNGREVEFFTVIFLLVELRSLAAVSHNQVSVMSGKIMTVILLLTKLYLEIKKKKACL